MDKNFLNSNRYFIKQSKEMFEILVGWETANRYVIMNEKKEVIGYLAELGKGLGKSLLRQFLRSHRPLEIEVINTKKQKMLRFSRGFFFFFSDLYVEDHKGKRLGSVHRQFAFFTKKYELCDEYGKVFATIQSSFWKLWRFPLFNTLGALSGEISKKWGGFLKEIFSDADTFMLDYSNEPWQENQKKVILAAAISIDLDFFEENQSVNGFPLPDSGSI